MDRKMAAFGYILLTIAAIFISDTLAGPCDDGKVYNEVCYKFMETEKAWDYASTDCKDKNMGDLPIVKSDSVNDFILKLVREEGKQLTNRQVWIGGKSTSIPWTWVLGNIKAEGNMTRCYYTPKPERRPTIGYVNNYMNPAQCQNYCYKEKTTLAGVFDGKSCYCGNADMLSFYTGTTCGQEVTCGGDRTRRCGNERITRVYDISGSYFSSWEASERQPNNGNSETTEPEAKSCAGMNKDFQPNYNWEDVYCRKTASYICEINLGQTECTDNTNFRYQDGTCYYINEQKKSWFDARIDCVAKGGDLVRILDQNKQNSIKGLLSGFNRRYHIGLSNRQYTWRTGEPMIYTKVASIKTYAVASGFGVSLDVDKGTWEVSHSSNPKYYVCAKECPGCADTTTSTVPPTTSPPAPVSPGDTKPAPTTPSIKTTTSGATSLGVGNMKYIFILIGVAIAAVLILFLVISLAYYFSPRWDTEELIAGGFIKMHQE